MRAQRYSVWGLGAALLGLLALTATPRMAWAQDTSSDKKSGGTGASGDLNLADRRVSLDIEGSLQDAIKQLMKSVRADYSFDSALKGATVNIHLKEVKFSVALDMLMKVSSLPAAYKLENGIYHIVPRVEEAPPPREEKPDNTPPAPEPPKWEVIKVEYVDAGEIARLLGGTEFRVGGQPYGLVDSNNISFGGGDLGGFQSYSNSGFGSGGFFGNGGTTILSNGGNSFNSSGSGSYGFGFGLGGFSFGGNNGGFRFGGRR